MKCLVPYVPLVVTLLLIRTPLFARDQTESDLQQPASWSVPSLGDVRGQVLMWLDESGASATDAAQVRALWQPPADGQPQPDVLETLAASIAVVIPEVRPLVNTCVQQQRPLVLPRPPQLIDENTPPLVRNNLRLLYGRWLATQELYDESLEQLADLALDEVVDPASLLFYQGVAYHRLLDKDKCLPRVEKLLENEPAIPRRYSTLAKLMEADLKPLKEDSLDEISRLMDNVRVRLGHGRAGKRVRQEEDDVVAKLDKMIEKLEEQQQQSQSSGSGGQLQPSSPMPDSMPGGGTGPGNVDPKHIGSSSDWGNLPPKERQEALQQISKDLPSHYRDVIEDYFRKLARDGVESTPETSPR